MITSKDSIEVNSWVFAKHERCWINEAKGIFYSHKRRIRYSKHNERQESSFPNGQSGRSHEYQENVRKRKKVYSKWNIQLSSTDNAERTLPPRISTTLRYSRKRVGCNRARRNQLRNMCCKVYSRSLRYLIWNILSLLLSFLKKSEQLAFRYQISIVDRFQVIIRQIEKYWGDLSIFALLYFFKLYEIVF